MHFLLSVVALFDRFQMMPSVFMFESGQHRLFMFDEILVQDHSGLKSKDDEVYRRRRKQ